jgi:hypothetical protein
VVASGIDTAGKSAHVVDTGQRRQESEHAVQRTDPPP